jgi:serine/threonine protein kinase
MRAMLSLEGKQLGNYDVIKRIRVGGMGAVYEGRQRTAFDRRVAIKVILGDYAADRDMRRRFAREARTIARLQHPHILPLIEFGDEQGILYLVMPFIDGGTLTSYLRRHLPGLDEVATLYTQLLDAVEYAHDEGLIHRDIKSSNVLLEMRRSGMPHVYLADFGLVRTMRQETTSQPGKPIPLDQVPGTPHYMAPEQTRGSVTTQTDIYALGVMLYQMLIGTLPYNDTDEIRVIQMHLHAPIPLPSEADGSLPRELDLVVRRAMAKRPEERFKTVAELRTAFLNAMHGPVEMLLDDDSDSEPEIEDVEDDDPALPFPEPLELPRPAPRPRRTGAMPPAQAPVEIYEEETREPPVQPRRLARNERPPVILREAREQVRNTDSVHMPRVRVTEEPVVRRKRRLLLPVLTSVLVTIILLGLVLAPKVLNVTILPAGLLPGSTNVATISIQLQQKDETNTFVLTASTSVQQTNLESRSIPARELQEKASSTKTVGTSGLRTINGTKATGTAIFTNPTGIPVTINPDAVFVANNISFHLPEPLTIQAHQGNQDGQNTGLLEALTEGDAGNIGPHALDGNTCCNNAILVSNVQAFSGGKDPQVLKTVATTDIDGAKQLVQKDLQTQVQQKLQKRLRTNEVMAGAPTFNITTTPNVPVDGVADQVKVTVTIEGKVTVYNHTTAEEAARNLLINQAKRDLGQSYDAYKLQDNITLVKPPEVSHQGNKVFLNVSVHGLWVYAITGEQVNQWQQAIKNTSKNVATAYLKSQPGVANVSIQMPTGGGEQLPAELENIRIDVQTQKIP